MATDDSTATDEAVEEASEEKQSLSLEVKVDSPSACERHVTVTVSRDDVDRYFDEAVSELMTSANVPGFRPGRAPRKLVESRFRKDVNDQIKGSLLMDTMTQVSEENEFAAISEPDFDYDAVEIPEDGPMTFEFDIEVRPEFDMPDWKGLKLEKPTRKITKKAVDEHLTNLLRSHCQMVPQDGKAKAGDYVVANITCRHNDEEVFSLEEQSIGIKPVLSFRDCKVEGFDKLMDGVKAEETKDTTAKISDNAGNESLRGEEVTIQFEVLEVKKLELPELDAALLDRLGGFDSEEGLREDVKENMERQLEYHQQKRVREQITETLTEAAKWELPPELLRRQSGRELDRAMMELQSAGFDQATIRAHENELRQNAQVATATALKEHFILERIAEEHELDVSDEDYDDEIGLIAAQAKDSPRRVRARLEKQGVMDALRNQIIERKVIALIESNAEFKEVKFKGDRTSDTEALDVALGGDQGDAIPDAKHGGDSQPLRQPAEHA